MCTDHVLLKQTCTDSTCRCCHSVALCPLTKAIQPPNQQMSHIVSPQMQ